jgi:flagella basal body P-ring formation protein FlgA
MLITLLLACIAKLIMGGRSTEDRVREAITDAVRDRMGETATVSVDDLTIERGIDADAVRAIPEPGSKLGRIIRFTLRAAGDRLTATGSATARVRVSVPHVHPTRHLDRGEEITNTDLVAVTHEISAGPLRALPSVTAASHARTLKPIAQNACVTASAIAALPAVRGGREIVAIARVDGVEARTTVMAAENGDAGSIIRVINRQTRRALKARVLSPELVEIIHD